MTRPIRRSRRSPTAGALELLARCSNRCTEARMRAHGFTVARAVEPARAGLATAQHVVAGQSGFEVATMRITEAERRALAQRRV
jgi:hypothetical protein